MEGKTEGAAASAAAAAAAVLQLQSAGLQSEPRTFFLAACYFLCSDILISPSLRHAGWCMHFKLILPLSKVTVKAAVSQMELCVLSTLSVPTGNCLVLTNSAKWKRKERQSLALHKPQLHLHDFLYQ